MWYHIRMKQVRQFVFSVAAAGLLTPVVVFAQFKNPLKSGLSTVAGFTEAFLQAVVFIMFPIAVVFVVYSGFLFIAAQGNSDELAKAKRNFFWTIVGVGLLLGAWALAKLIQGTIDPILSG